MRRFEFRDATSAKFWEIDVDEAKLVVRFGRLGTKGQAKPKTCTSPDEAQRQAAVLVAEKLAKGYVEVGGTEPPRAAASAGKPAARPAAPKPQAITRARFGGRDGKDLVIQLQGTAVLIQGEGQRLTQSLDSVADARSHFERIVMLRKKGGYTLLEQRELAAEDVASLDALDIEQFDGSFEVEDGRYTITFEGEADAPISLSIAQALVGRVAKAAPRCLHLVCDLGIPGHGWQEALSGASLPELEAFIFDNPAQTATRQAENGLGDLAAVLAACPRLEQLYACGAVKLSATTHAALRGLHLVGDPLPATLPAGLAGSTFPALETLVLDFASDGGPIDEAAMLDAMLGLRAPNLSAVHLQGVDDVPALLGSLAAHGLPKGWKTLSLQGTSDSAYELEDLEPIVSAREASLRSLQALYLALPPDELASLREILPSVADAETMDDPFLPSVYDGW